MRQIMRALGRVDLCLRIYKNRPIDVSLLVWWAFDGRSGVDYSRSALNRINLIYPVSSSLDANGFVQNVRLGTKREPKFDRNVAAQFLELAFIDGETFANVRNFGFAEWHPLLERLEKYNSDHQAMLDAVHKLQVDP